ncbi:TIGR04083 family peptide-modifying radical SAM enzyme [Methanoplanus sp. FWC-SCC4]|uniref:TIGR04083 family peptide-modifying radical SAM enzyme n=1 Tax=Methanochimaera problematica TaxID=2609417 RepID=A0AA97FA74_9EURY|nr:TIGR04083 family peptide-modifying radical SAM enzyme [Methanoplanus sp. FWC-SCC4]WOF15655.1 TIGR04083 family peptide-modifying radical SAM enzyme [Methanoplanus sp. FWC-SCC4]
MKNPFHVMIIPTLGCPCNCSYCWSSDENSPVMTIDTVRAIAEWLKDLKDIPVTFTFHGGEPLLAGPEFYREALPILSKELTHLTPDFALQSNLWLLTPEIAKILAEYKIPIGSSIDGPKEINDSQRGEGYFEKTMEGWKIAKENGLNVRFICTFTGQSVESKDEILNFFLENGLTLKLHPALPSLRDNNPDKWALSPEKYGELLIYLLDKSLEHINDLEIMNVNDLCRCVFTRNGSVCTFADCMGSTFAVGPDGNIYPCYRFVGMPKFVMGNVYEKPSIDDLMNSDAGKLMTGFKSFVDKECGECPHINYCRGGCPYNAIAPTNGEIKAVDPHCAAYNKIFDEINERLNKEMFEEPGAGISPVQSRIRRNKKPGVMALMRRNILK